MAPRIERDRERHRLLEKKNPLTKNKIVGAEDNGGSEKLPFIDKLMLSATLWGNEASCDFEHIYTVPMLQTLGLPLSFASMTGLFSGPTATLLLPFVGWLTDRGLNPRHRKDMAMIAATFLVLAGMACIVIANVLHLNYLIDYNGRNAAAYANVSNFSKSIFQQNDATEFMSNGSELRGHDDDLYATVSDSSASPHYGRISENESSAIPFRAGLGMLGFILLDIGYDANNAFSKTFVLSCGARSEHKSLLVIGLIMGSAGGVSTALLGLVDFAWLFDLDYIEGGSMPIRMIVQSLVVLLFLTFGIFISLYTGRRLRRRQNISNNNNNIKNNDDPEAVATSNLSTNNRGNNLHFSRDELFSRSIATDTFENSIRSFGGGATHFDQSLVLLEEHQEMTSAEGHHHQDFPSEQTPLMVVDEDTEENEMGCDDDDVDDNHDDDDDDDGDGESEEELLQSLPTNLSSSYGAITSVQSTPEQHLSLPTGVAPHTDSENALAKVRPCCKQSFTIKIIMISLSVYFSDVTVLMFTMISSDYVGKAIFEGNPDAAPGTDSLARYQMGVRMASWGFLIYYASYLLVSFVHHQILTLLGAKLEFTLIHLVMSMCTVSLALTARLEVFFLLAVVAGLQRACFFVVPFTFTSDILQAEALLNPEDGKDKIGFAMTMVSAAMPLSFCTLFSWIGSAVQATELISLPIWLSSGYAILSLVVFNLIEKPQSQT